MDLLLLWVPSAFLVEQEWEQGDHGDHSLTTQSLAQGTSQATTSGLGSSEHRWCGTSSPGANETRQTMEGGTAWFSTHSLHLTDFTSNVHLPVEYATEQHVVRLQAAKCNTGTMILKIYSGKQRRKKLGVWHLGCSPLSEAGKQKEQDHFIYRKL